MTNFEKIKNMSKEELAELLQRILQWDYYTCEFNGVDEALEWLEQEAYK